MPTRDQNDPRPIHDYRVDTVDNLLGCLPPHVLRGIRDSLTEREPRFAQERHRRECSQLLSQIEEILIALDGEA